MSNETTTRTFQGTPGPWEMGYDGLSRPIITTADHSMLSISRFEFGKWGSYEREDYDARLISAAPLLLEACIAALILVRVAYTEDSEVGRQLEAAIVAALPGGAS